MFWKLLMILCKVLMNTFLFFSGSSSANSSPEFPRKELGMFFLEPFLWTLWQGHVSWWLRWLFAHCCVLLYLSMPPLYWATSAAPWLWRSYLGFTLTADSRVSSWYIFKQRVHTVYLLPSTAFVMLPIWHRTWTGEHRHGMPHNISSSHPSHSWENSFKQESPDS